MIIGVDGNEANVEKKVGVSVYTLKLLNYFSKKANADNQFIIYLKNPPRSDLPKENNYFRYQVIKGNFFWSQFFLPLNLYLKKKINLFFSPAHYAPRFSPVPTVVTIHDLSFFYYPQEFLKKDFYQLKNWTRYSVEKANKVIAVSKTTKKDLIKFYHLPEEKIVVIYNGYEKELKIPACKTGRQSSNLKNKIKNFKMNKPYILFVGTIQPRKNILTLIKAFSLLLNEKPQFSLVLVGKKGWLYQKMFAEIESNYSLLLKNQKIVFLDYVDDQLLTLLYQNAFAFVLPSFYEGFGIPLLEAMSFNCPVISSFSSSLPEIGADACLYFDPHSPFDLKEKMLELVNNPELKKELIKKGKERIKFFSWEKCGQETLQLLTRSDP